MTLFMRFMVCGVMAWAMAGCAEEPPEAAESPGAAEVERGAVVSEDAPPKLQPRLVVPPEAPEGIAFTQRQRSTAGLPGSRERVLMTLDDITRGQVMLSITTSDQQSVVPLRSVSAGDEVRFELDEQGYILEMAALENRLTGQDVAHFVLHAATASDDAADKADRVRSASAMTEEQKIERLIRAVAELEGATFIRNGEEHSPAEAVEHMRRKWEWKKDEIRTAEDFIRLAASESSTSGKAYMIRLPDGREVKSAELLRQKLREME